MFVVFLHGPVASGKYTVGKALSAATGLPLFHNHLTVDLALSLFEFGSPPFVELRERIWLLAFEAAAVANRSFIFTFAPENTVRPQFIVEAQAAVTRHGGRIHFVELSCSETEIEARLDNASRHEFGKMTSVENYRKYKSAGAFEFPPLPLPLLRISTESLSASEAASRVAAALSEIEAK